MGGAQSCRKSFTKESSVGHASEDLAHQEDVVVSLLLIQAGDMKKEKSLI